MLPRSKYMRSSALPIAGNVERKRFVRERLMLYNVTDRVYNNGIFGGRMGGRLV